MASHEKFVAKYELGVTLLSDENLEGLKAYGAWGTKKMYGKEVEGVIRSTYLIGPGGVVRAAWPKVTKAAGHAEKVLLELEKLSVVD